MSLLSKIEGWVAAVGRAAGYLNLVLIVLIVADVALRATLDYTAAWVGELSWHLFALVFMLGIPYALQQNRHVRVDLFYEGFTPAQRRTVDLVGHLLFLLPWTLVMLWTGAGFAAEAWATGEGSPNPNGLPTFFPVKALIPLAATLLLLQTIASCVHALKSPAEKAAANPPEA